MHEPQVVNDVQVRRARAAVGAERDVDAARQHLAEAMRRMSKVFVRPRTVNDAGLFARQDAEFVVVAVIHVRKQGWIIEQADLHRKSYRASGISRYLVVESTDRIP